jgi:hypothetical protein
MSGAGHVSDGSDESRAPNGRGMEERPGKGVTTHEFDALVDDLVSSLDRISLPEAEREELLGQLVPVDGDVADRVMEGQAQLTGTAAGRPIARSRMRIIVGVALCALLVLVPIALIQVMSRSPARRSTTTTDAPSVPIVGVEPPSSQGPSPSPESPAGLDVHVSAPGGYLFSYPNTWGIRNSGSTTHLASPDGDVVMTFRIAPPGPLHEAADQQLTSVTTAYRDVELVAGRVERTLQGLRSYVVGGTAIDANGASFDFLVITIEGPEKNHGISVRFSAEAKPLDALPAIQQIVASFRVSPTE